LKRKLTESFLLLAIIGLSACGGGKLWPFDGSNSDSAGYAPANSTEYQCEGNSKFYVRMLNNGNDAWLILPDREVSLSKTGSDGGMHYSNGISVLSINGEDATLSVNETRKLSQCKAVSKDKSKK